MAVWRRFEWLAMATYCLRLAGCIGVMCGRSALTIGWPFVARLAGVFTAAGALLLGWPAGIVGRNVLLAFTAGTKKPAHWPAQGWGWWLLVGDHYDNG